MALPASLADPWLIEEEGTGIAVLGAEYQDLKRVANLS
jgi:hypothetical protein